MMHRTYDPAIAVRVAKIIVFAAFATALTIGGYLYFRDPDNYYNSRVASQTENNGLKPGDPMTIKLPGGAKMTFHWCPPGEFIMGSDYDEDGLKKPVHRVKLTKGFWMGETEVTQNQWKSVMGNNPSDFKGWFKGNCPVENVSWNDCQEFIKKVKNQTGLDVSLPTEAQWEYACRAGTTSDYAGDLDDMAWYWDNSGKKTHSVGTKAANKWGLHDMHGNVWEWCQDWYGDYGSGDATNPLGPSTGSERMGRGGSCYDYPRYCRSDARDCYEPECRVSDLGFRLALVQGSN